MKDQYLAELRIKIGDDRKYIRVMDKNIKYKRGSIEIKYEGGIAVKVVADDPTALIASLSSVVKQLKVINSVGKVVRKETSASKR